MYLLVHEKELVIDNKIRQARQKKLETIDPGFSSIAHIEPVIQVKEIGKEPDTDRVK